MPYDKIIIGAGLYGLYAARYCARKGERLLVLEKDAAAFSRATTINQARVHMGYHYPRSLSTARRCAGYFERFMDDFGDCVNRDFEQIYATSKNLSWTNADDFRRFCDAAAIPCEEVAPAQFFKPGQVDGAFRTREYTYDAVMLRRRLIEDLTALPGVQIRYGSGVTAIERQEDGWVVTTARGDVERAPYLLNAAYASVNEVLALAGGEPFDIKYELCELILCEAGEPLAKTGITVMDGPFFSIMPFGCTGMHSLTSVCATPHYTCHDKLPAFPCQRKKEAGCAPEALANCNECPARPRSAWPQMSQLARRYLREEYGFAYKGALYSVKPILRASEVDDSRPTLVRSFRPDGDGPVLVSVLSGKINTVYDLEEVL